MNHNITFCGIYRNEALNIRRVLDIAASLCSRMVIGVQTSDDGTLQIAEEYATDNLHRVIPLEPEPPEISRDRVISKVGTGWTFWLDADEVPSIELVRFIRDFKPEQYLAYNGIKFPRINYINGFHIEANEAEDEQFRLLRSDVRWNALQQGRVCHLHPQVSAPLTIPLPLYHHRTLEKIERTTRLWNSMEPSTIMECNDYLKRVQGEVKKNAYK